MPNSETFSIPPIKALLDLEIASAGKGWLDPFSRNAVRAELTNDLNPGTNAKYRMDAVDFLRRFPDEFAEGVLYDPPYGKEIADWVRNCFKDLAEGRELPGVRLETSSVTFKFFKKLLVRFPFSASLS
jgi:hypothetical protein